MERGAETPLGRALAENDEPCKQSCDAGHDRHCDAQDSAGEWKLSCDLHPTTSCDSDCHYPPPPPLDPWMGASARTRRRRRRRRRPDAELLRAAWIYFLVALLLFLCCACYSIYHYSHSSQGGDGSGTGARASRTGAAASTCWRSRGDHWDQEERDAQNANGRDAQHLHR